jgi:hypothetical protein
MDINATHSNKFYLYVQNMHYAVGEIGCNSQIQGHPQHSVYLSSLV